MQWMATKRGQDKTPPPAAASRPSFGPDVDALAMLLLGGGFLVLVCLLLPLLDPGGRFPLPEWLSAARLAVVEPLGVGAVFLAIVPLLLALALLTRKSPLRMLRFSLGVALLWIGLGSWLAALGFGAAAGALLVTVWALMQAGLGVLSWLLAFVLLVVIGCLGLDLMLFKPLSHFEKKLLAALGRLALWTAETASDLMEEGKISRETIALRRALRSEIRAQQGALSALARSDLRSEALDAELQTVSDALKAMDLKQLSASAQHTSRQRKTIAALIERQRALVGGLLAKENDRFDASELRRQRAAAKGGGGPLGVELYTTGASERLGWLRRQHLDHLRDLLSEHERLGREHRRAEKAIAKPKKQPKEDATQLQQMAARLQQEKERYEARVLRWKQFAEGAEEWQQISGDFAGWPELVKDVDALPTAELAAELAAAIAEERLEILPKKKEWQLRLQEALAAPVAAPQAQASEEPFSIDMDFSIDMSFDDLGAPAPTLTAPPMRPPPSKPKTAPAPADKSPLPLALPSLDLLDPLPAGRANLAALEAEARARADLINSTLDEFRLQARVVDWARGPTVTRYEISPAAGEKISRITSLSNDIARALAVAGVRTEAPVPGKSVIGLEVPNATREPVTFHQALVSSGFMTHRGTLPVVVGKSIDGEMISEDLASMPHLLIAGSTGAGKSVCVNALIQSLLFRFYPQELRFLMIDPKMVELTPYQGIPHLLRPVITDPSEAAAVLNGAVSHMERRYKLLSGVGAKNLAQYNAKMRATGEPELPHMVIVIDELADLMMTSAKEVEAAIMRLAQMARATGMHLVLATQRPSVDILTSLIKVNVPARIAFAVSSSHDSRTILDTGGAERLTGMGDMLFYRPGYLKPQRLQGPFIGEDEGARVVELLSRMTFEDEFGEEYGPDFEPASADGFETVSGKFDFSDPYLKVAAQIVIEEGQGSVSRLQRRLGVGHARAGKLMDMMEAMGIVGKHQGSKPREVLVTGQDLPQFFG